MKYGNYGPTKKRFRVMKSPITIILACIILAVLIKATWSIHKKAVIADTKLVQAKSELAKLQARDQDLQLQVGYLSTDQGVEAELRTKYRAVKDGESVAVIMDDSQPAAAIEASSSSSSSTVGVSWWRRFLSFFGL